MSPTITDLAPRLRAAGSAVAVTAVHAGVVAYADGRDLQRRLVARRDADEIDDVLLTLEHPPVYTLGKRADTTHVLWDEDERAARGIDLHEVDRGGDVTYHGPGQLVAYPVLRLHGLRNVVEYVRALEEVAIRVAADFGIEAQPVEGFTGCWVGDEKLVAIGVRVSRHGITSHGLAFNVTTDLEHFAGIVPCGIEGRGVCSLASLGVDTSVEAVTARLRERFGEVFGCTVRPATPDDHARLLA